MANSGEIRSEAEALRGRRTGVRYGDLAGALRRCDCNLVSEKGSHRTWAYPRFTQHLTLVDDGRRELYTMRTRKFLLAIAEFLDVKA
jgi:hypothetical protein